MAVSNMSELKARNNNSNKNIHNNNNNSTNMRKQLRLAIVAVLVLYVALHWRGLEEGEMFTAYNKQVAPPTLSPTSAGATEDAWFVIVSTSRFWQNYRHTTNALSLYWAARRSGVPDDHIVLMIAEKHACDARNSFAGTAYADSELSPSLFCAGVDIDYVGDSVTAVNFLRVLTGNVPAGTPRQKQIFPTKHSNVVVYMTGHRGDNFMKFHDYEFLSSYDMAQALWRMHRKERYHRLLLIVHTCQAATR